MSSVVDILSYCRLLKNAKVHTTLFLVQHIHAYAMLWYDIVRNLRQYLFFVARRQFNSCKSPLPDVYVAFDVM